VVRPVSLKSGTGDSALAAGHHVVASSHLARGASGASIPNFAPLPLHGYAGGIADLDPDAARTGAIRAIDLLRHDAFRTKPAGVREDDNAVLGDVFVDREQQRAAADVAEPVDI
jgi:hypothetical protein